MPETLLILMRHNDRLIESSICRLVSNLVVQTGRKRLQQLKQVAHGRLVYF